MWCGASRGEADGFEALVKALHNHDSSQGPLMPYIVLRCRGAMIDGLRKKMLISRNDRAKGVTEPEVVSLEHEVEEGVRLLDILADPNSPTPGVASLPVTNIPSEVAALPMRYQRILLMRFLQRRSQKDIAAVLRLAAEGASAAETANSLCKAVETVKTQRCAILAKLHARNMTNAVAISYQRGLLR